MEAEFLRIEAEVAQLRRLTRMQSREIEQLRATARLVVEEPDTMSLARAIARQAADLLIADRAMVAMVVDDEPVVHAYYPSSEVDSSEKPDVRPGESVASSVASWVIRKQQPHISTAPSERPGLVPSFAKALACRSVLCVPILNHQRIVTGVIEVHNRRQGGVFSPAHVPVAETLADEASIGFERARLFDRMHEWSQSLEMLLGFSAAINQRLNPSLLLRQLVENAARFLKADGGMAGLAIPSHEPDSIVMSSEAYWSRGVWHERPRSWERNQGLPGCVLENEFPYLANEYQEDRVAEQDLIAGYDVRRAICSPIKATDNTIVGFFELHKGPGQTPFTWQDAAFLESLANTTAVAIQNARLLKALEVKSDQIQTLSANHVRRIEEERKHIARELHDEAGQALIGIKLALQVLARQIPEGMADLRGELDHLRQQVNGATSHLKDLARRLRPPTLDQLGLEVALRQLASEFQDVTGIAVVLALSPLGKLPSQEAGIALYRIAQEALTNVAKHSGAASVSVGLGVERDRIELIIVDDGCGFDPSQSVGGLGLLGMKERVAMLAGDFTVESRPGEGARVSVCVPLP
jgi:two-component system sensor histidine kinase UhpB